MPLSSRYARNAALTDEEQGRLGRGRVLLVGLGGLGGHVLDMLLRTGVADGEGRLMAVDGDIFEASNLNRQLLCTEATLGRLKAEVAAEYARNVNSAVRFEARSVFLRTESDVDEAVAGMDVVVDALGGLAHRALLHNAAGRAKIPVVSAGIAGFTGWVCTLLPGAASPAPLLGAGAGVEERLGNLACTAAMAASLQVAETLNLLTGRPSASGLLLFDLSDRYVTQVREARM